MQPRLEAEGTGSGALQRSRRGPGCSGQPRSPVAEQPCVGARALSCSVSPLGNLEKIAPVIRPLTA